MHRQSKRCIRTGYRTRIPAILLSAALAVASSACGGNGNSISPPPAISVSPSGVTVQPGSTQQFTATIDTGSGGSVSWTLTCSSVPCGTVSPTSTASGASTTYTPPVTLPAANLSVTLTATSMTDSAKFASASATVPQIAGFNGVSESPVDTVNGVARLIVNGKPAPPLGFFYPDGFPDRAQYLAPEIQDAVTHGIHLFNVYPHWPWDNQNTATLDFSQSDQALDQAMQSDAQALLVVALGLWPGNRWIPSVQPTANDYTLYPGGYQVMDTYHASFASDIFFNGFLTSVPHFFQHYENTSYADPILGYELDWAGTGEWYPVKSGEVRTTAP